MDYKERNKILSSYEHIFKNEEVYYNKRIARSIETFDLEKEDFFRLAYIKFKDMLGNVKGKKVLDIGCGSGSLSFYLAREGANVLGIDLSKNFIDSCKKKAEELKFNIEFKVMNAQVPDFEDNAFDIIVGSRVIHHLPNKELFYRECKRILKKKGYIAFIEPLKKNPIVQLNRKYFAPKRRTKYENPLLISEAIKAKNIFGNIEHAEYFLLSPLAKFFAEFIRLPAMFKVFYKFLNLIEKPLYKINYFKQYCWQTVFKCIKI